MKNCFILFLWLTPIFFLAANEKQCQLVYRTENGSNIHFSFDHHLLQEIISETKQEAQKSFGKVIAGFPGLPKYNQKIDTFSMIATLGEFSQIFQQIEKEENYPIYSYVKILERWAVPNQTLKQIIPAWYEAVSTCETLLTSSRVSFPQTTSLTKKSWVYPNDYPKNCIKQCLHANLPGIPTTTLAELKQVYTEKLQYKLTGLIDEKFNEPGKLNDYKTQVFRLKDDYFQLEKIYSEKQEKYLHLKRTKEENENIVQNKKHYIKLYSKQYYRNAKKILKEEVYPYYEQVKLGYEEIEKEFEPIQRKYQQYVYNIRRIKEIQNGKIDSEISQLRELINNLLIIPN